jgi:hypothetical protein
MSRYETGDIIIEVQQMLMRMEEFTHTDLPLEDLEKSDNHFVIRRGCFLERPPPKNNGSPFSRGTR